MFVSAEDYRKEIWRKKYPTTIGILLSIFQMILSMVIIGCEITNMFFHFPRMNLFLGYWIFPLFTCAWISLAGTSCCCRIRCCGIVTLVFQCLAIPMALCVVGFDVYFLINPTQCWLSNTCNKDGFSDRTELFDTTTLYNIKIPLIKGQLAAGGLMVVSHVIYIIIFIITTHHVKNTVQSHNDSPVSIAVMPQPTNYNPPPIINSHSNIQNRYPVNRTIAPPYNAPVEIPMHSIVSRNQMTCPNCNSRFQIAPLHN